MDTNLRYSLINAETLTVSFFLNNKRYKAGTTNKLINVETNRPEIIVQANGGHNVLFVTTSGNNLQLLLSLLIILDVPSAGLHL